jgi:hypothetical protein
MAVGIGVFVGLGEAIDVLVGCGVGVADAEEQAMDRANNGATTKSALALKTGAAFISDLLCLMTYELGVSVGSGFGASM